MKVLPYVVGCFISFLPTLLYFVSGSGAFFNLFEVHNVTFRCVWEVLALRLGLGWDASCFYM